MHRSESPQNRNHSPYTQYTSRLLNTTVTRILILGTLLSFEIFSWCELFFLSLAGTISPVSEKTYMPHICNKNPHAAYSKPLICCKTKSTHTSYISLRSHFYKTHHTRDIISIQWNLQLFPKKKLWWYCPAIPLWSKDRLYISRRLLLHCKE